MEDFACSEGGPKINLSGGWGFLVELSIVLHARGGVSEVSGHCQRVAGPTIVPVGAKAPYQNHSGHSQPWSCQWV